MKGDFTRGHRPDSKRKTPLDPADGPLKEELHGKRYRRVLLQEGRLVLDSDIAASVDASDSLLRDLAVDVGCRNGSANLGYLVTPGPLFALFEDLDRVDIPAPPSLFEAWRDYAVKLQDRFPSLYLGATQEAGSVTIRSRLATPPALQTTDPLAPMHFPRLRIWARIAAGTSLQVSVNGVAAPALVGTGVTPFDAYDVDVAALGLATYDEVTLGFGGVAATNEAWVVLIEGLEEAEIQPRFWVTWGRYYLQGLEVELNARGLDGWFPETSFPLDLGFDPPADVTPVVGQYLLAYLEGWERLVTRIEDPGVLEQALGGAIDTTVRSSALGQVKLALFDGDPGAPGGSDLVPPAFANVVEGDGTLLVTTTPSGVNPDPCAIPEDGGYTGNDNRFYRFEVHGDGPLGTATIKASRNNGSDLFAIIALADALAGLVTLAAGASVRDGDLVELLFEADDLGDAEPATVVLAPPALLPAQRKVGVLFYVRGTDQTGTIQLLDFVTKLPVALDATAMARPGAKLRVWDVLLDTALDTTFDLGDGITIELTAGQFQAGDYWQYEARRLQDNANGAWQATPHGPERLFAPLALLRYQGPLQPLELVRWYDHQFSPLCALNADDIAYDGDKVGTEADTVQEAIDELYVIVNNIDGGDGCCDLTIDAGDPGDDDGARIQDAVNQLGDSGVLCLKRGVYHLKSTVTIASKVTIVGCPHATLVGEGGVVFELDNGADLTLAQLIVFKSSSPDPIIDIPPPDGKVQLTLREVALVQAAEDSIAVRQGVASVPSVDAGAPGALPSPAPSPLDMRIVADRSIVLGAVAVAAGLLRSSAMRETLLAGEEVALYARGIKGFELHRCRLAAVIDAAFRAQLLALAVADLEVTLPPLLEALPGGGGVGSIALLAGGWEDGVIEETRFDGSSSLVAAGVLRLQSTRNLYQAGPRAAIRVDKAGRAVFHGDMLIGGSIGLHLPYSAGEVTVEGSDVRGMLALVLGADATGNSLPAPVGALQEIRIRGNTIRHPAAPDLSKAVGIAFGPFEDTIYATFDAIEVAGNELPGESGGISISSTILDPAFDPQQDPKSARSVRVVDNHIGPVSHQFAVRMIGPGLEVSRNTIVHRSTGRATAIALYDATGAVVQGNVITDIGPASSTVGILLSPDVADGAQRDAVVESNSVILAGVESEPLVVVGTQAGRYRRLRAVDNDLRGFRSRLARVDDSVVRGNRMSASLFFEGARGGTVTDNSIEGVGKGPNRHLAITAAEDRWQVSGNRCDGDIIIDPLVLNGEEVAYVAQVVGNWAGRRLRVGNTPAVGPKPNQATIVMIDDNIALSELVVNEYDIRLEADNMAKTFVPAVGAGAHPTVVHNVTI